MAGENKSGAKLGGRPLTEAKIERLSIMLCGPSGTGKTLGAASFGGGPYGKILVWEVESGPEGGAGGANSLLGVNEAYPWISPNDIQLVTIRSLDQLNAEFQHMQKHYQELVEAGFTTFVFDGYTELGWLYEEAITSLNPRALRGAPSAAEKEAVSLSLHKRELIPNLLGESGKQMSMDDYGIILSRVSYVHFHCKLWPFTYVCTTLPGPIYDFRNPQGEPIGVGPELPGRVLPTKMMPRFDIWLFTYSPQTLPISVRLPAGYYWMTQTNNQGVFAKHRFGSKLKQYEPAGGVALLKKVGALPLKDIKPLKGKEVKS